MPVYNPLSPITSCLKLWFTVLTSQHEDDDNDDQSRSDPALCSSALCCLIAGSDVIQSPLVWRYEGQSATLTCSHTKGSTYQQMYWYRQLPGEGMKQIVYTTSYTTHEYGSGFTKDKFPAQKNDSETGSLIVKELQRNDSAVYFCAVSERQGNSVVYFGAGTKLTVLEQEVTKPVVTVFEPSQNECRNHKDNTRKKTILCLASGFYPDHVTVFWQINGKNVTSGVASSNAKRDGKNKTYSITSRLRVLADDWHNPKISFSCVVAFFDQKTTVNYTDRVFGKEVKEAVKIRGTYLRKTHTFKLCYTVFIIKSSIYGAIVTFLVWKLKGSARKWN